MIRSGMIQIVTERPPPCPAKYVTNHQLRPWNRRSGSRSVALQAGRTASHPELVLFKTWAELQEYALYDPAGQDLAALVEVIDGHGIDVVLDAIRRLHDEADAEVTVSTAHKAKGREWRSVRIAGDFEPSPSDERNLEGVPIPRPIGPEEARLAYVAVTRARDRLDLGGLSWIETHPDGRPGPGVAAPAAAAAVQAPVNHFDLPATSPLAAQPSPWGRLGPPPAL